MENSGGPLDNQTWQAEWKSASLDKVQLCEYENQTLEAFGMSVICIPSLIAQWPARILATMHYCETGLLRKWKHFQITKFNGVYITGGQALPSGNFFPYKSS